LSILPVAASGMAGSSVQALLEQLDAMESKVEKIVVPLSYTDELYALRNNIHLVRKKLLRKA
jgi:hypothetical protein